jgi:hypothetical protein
MARRRWRLASTSVCAVVTVAAQVYLALPVIPERALASAGFSSMSMESVGWPALVAQVGEVYRGLPEAQRREAVVLAENFGEAGAVDRFGPEYGLPAVYSGHNELYRWGPPPESAGVVVALGIAPDRLTEDFARCEVVTVVDNGVGVDNAEQGVPISVCTERRAPWARLWPGYHHLNAYL